MVLNLHTSSGCLGPTMEGRGLGIVTTDKEWDYVVKALGEVFDDLRKRRPGPLL